MMKLRFALPSHLIDLSQIDALRGIHEDGDEIVIGAMTAETELLRAAGRPGHEPHRGEVGGGFENRHPRLERDP